MNNEKMDNTRNLKSVPNMKGKSQVTAGLMVHAKGDGGMESPPGNHVGRVDHLDGDKFIKLTKDDSPTGQHRWVPIEWVEKVDGNSVYLNKTEQEFRSQVLKSAPLNQQKAV